MDNIINTQKYMGNKPVIVCRTLHNPTVKGEFESLADRKFVNFGVERKALFDTIFGDSKSYAHIPAIMPRNMESIEFNNEDIFDDVWPYE